MGTKIMKHGIGYYFTDKPKCPECCSGDIEFAQCFGSDDRLHNEASFICLGCGCHFAMSVSDKNIKGKKRLTD